MAIFELKSDLPLKTQKKIDYLEAIPVANRTANQTAFLTALTPYLTNQVIKVDVDGNILAASGLTVPTGYSGFAKGATFIKIDASGKGVYENVGTTTSASWDLMGAITSADIDDKAITSAKLADSISFDGKHLILNEVTPVNAVAASKVLTSDNTEVADGDKVTIGTVVYTFKDTPAAAYDVKRHGTTADTTMGNLIKAINASGTEGVEYFAGTLAHPDVTAGTLGSHAFTVTAKGKGVIGNRIAISEDSSHLSWASGAVFLSGGINGTVGSQWEVVLDATNLYIAVDDNTITDTNWKKLVLQSL